MSELKRAIELAELFVAQEAKVAETKEAHDEAKRKFNRTAQTDIPELFRELGITELKLESGRRITVKPDVSVALPEATRPAFFAWLREHDFGGIIKTNIQVSFDSDQPDAAQTFAEEMSQRGLIVSRDEGIHAGTLKAFVKEQMEKGEPLPDSINIHPYDIAKVEKK